VVLLASTVRACTPPASHTLACTRYTAYRSYDERGVGCAVLLRDSAFVRDASVDVVRLPASDEHGRKAGIVVHATQIRRQDELADTGDHAACQRDPQSPPQPLAIASLHLKACRLRGDPSVKLALLHSALTSVAPHSSVLLGGDFNTAVDELRRQNITSLLNKHGLQRVPTPSGVPTGLRGNHTWDKRQVIDHVYASRLLVCPSADVSVGPLPTTGSRGPWGPKQHHSGSDHAWLLLNMVAAVE